ncbi:OadG family protein [Fusobacterium hominis]|uniref:OadG family protein n=1 Tax=Fusobacterium hominis TaxID=2764326 RepID=UPI0022E7A2DF|nr:OadG family protein [Fusobacterium hominis]
MRLDFKTALELSVVSMGIVFLTLYGISLVLGSFKKIFKEKKVIEQLEKEVEKKVVKVAPKKNITYKELEEDEDMLVATLVASIEAAKENKNSNFKVTSIRKINN